MSDLKEGIRKIADDLTNLEINTIVRTDIVGTKMPHPRHALIDIANWYAACLSGMLSKPPHSRDFSGEVKWSAVEGAKRTYNPANCRYKGREGDSGRVVYSGSYQYFDILRELANEGIGTLGKIKSLSPDQEADYVMLYRIRDTSDQIKGVFNSLAARCGARFDESGRSGAPERITESPAGSDEGGGERQVSVDRKVLKSMQAAAERVARDRREEAGKPGRDRGLTGESNVEPWDNNYTRAEIERHMPAFPLTASELVTIRKAWEIGTEKIAMQTVIQLDGDVVTRVSPEYANGDQKDLHEIHWKSVTVSMDTWSQLIGLVKDFFEGIIEFFERKKLL